MRYADIKNTEIGNVIYENMNEWDTPRPYSVKCIVTEIHTEHIIAKDSMGCTLWIDEDNADMFSKSPKYKERKN